MWLEYIILRSRVGVATSSGGQASSHTDYLMAELCRSAYVEALIHRHLWCVAASLWFILHSIAGGGPLTFDSCQLHHVACLSSRPPVGDQNCHLLWCGTRSRRVSRRGHWQDLSAAAEYCDALRADKALESSGAFSDVRQSSSDWVAVTVLGTTVTFLLGNDVSVCVFNWDEPTRWRTVVA